MLHLLAILLTLFPGFGLGYLLLKRFRDFFNTLVISALMAAFIAILDILGPPNIPVREGLGIVPFLVWNIFHAHRLWLKVSEEESDEEVQQERSPFKMHPIVIGGVFALAALLGVLSLSSFFPEDQAVSSYKERRDASREAVLGEVEEGKLRRKEVETKLDQHKLTYKIGFTTEGPSHFSYLYHVEPGRYTMMVHFVTSMNSQQMRSVADEIASYTDDFVYASGFEVYELNTRNRGATLRLIADLDEHLSMDCNESEGFGVCGYEPQ